MKKGFSLAELMIVLVVAGTIASLTIPVLMQNTNDTDKVLYKSAFRLVETVVNELVSDLAIFPTGEITSASTFCNEFVKKVNTIGTFSCATSTIPGTPNFKTTNGMRWYGLNTSFAAANCPSGYTGNCMKIHVDVNGEGKGQNADGNDILEIIVFDTGKLTAPAGTETTYLTN